MILRTPRDIGALIRDRRRRQKLDQRSLADRAGVSRQWLIEVERGKPRAEIGLVLRALAALGVRLSVADDYAREGAPVDVADIDAIVEQARQRPPGSQGSSNATRASTRKAARRAR